MRESSQSEERKLLSDNDRPIYQSLHTGGTFRNISYNQQPTQPRHHKLSAVFYINAFFNLISIIFLAFTDPIMKNVHSEGGKASYLGVFGCCVVVFVLLMSCMYEKVKNRREGTPTLGQVGSRRKESIDDEQKLNDRKISTDDETEQNESTAAGSSQASGDTDEKKSFVDSANFSQGPTQSEHINKPRCCEYRPDCIFGFGLFFNLIGAGYLTLYKPVMKFASIELNKEFYLIGLVLFTALAIFGMFLMVRGYQAAIKEPMSSMSLQSF